MMSTKPDPKQYYADNYPDMDPADLEVCLAFDASVDVAYHVCPCDIRHPVEYTPEPHRYYATGSTCACGRHTNYKDPEE